MKFLCPLLLFIVVFTVCDTFGKPQVLVGGTGPEKPADDKIKTIFQNPNITKAAFTKLQAESNSNTVPTNLEPLTYKSQVVAGVNYFVKALVTFGEERQVWWIKVFQQSWTNTLDVTGVKGPKQLTEEVTYF